MGSGWVKRVFPGGNTCKGFYSFYDHIIEPDAVRIMVIKGGPGVGKSTFMKKIASGMQAKGFSLEFHCCSSDNGSIDGVVFPEINIAIIDGTAPHMVEPRNPGCVGEIIDLGRFWDEKALMANKHEILACNREISQNYARAYRFLKAAKDVYDDLDAVYTEGLRQGKVNKLVDRLIRSIFGRRKVLLRPGAERHLFASAITPDGPVNHLESIMGLADKRYILKGVPGPFKSRIIEKVLDAGIVRGYYIEVFHCALDPDRLEHLFIPDLGVALVTSEEPHEYAPKDGDVAIDLEECIYKVKLKELASSAEYDWKIFRELMERAVSFLKNAKEAHDEIESYYVPYMDFSAVEELREETFQRILSYTN
jgi:hypothetical protein